METTTILSHARKMDAIALLITKEVLSIEQLKRMAETKNFIFYTSDELEEWKEKFTHKLQIKEATLEKLKNTYINELSKLN